MAGKLRFLTDWLPTTTDSTKHSLYSITVESYKIFMKAELLRSVMGVERAKIHLNPEWYPLIDYCWQNRQDTTIHVPQPADPKVFNQVIAFSEYASRLGEEYELPGEH